MRKVNWRTAQTWCYAIIGGCAAFVCIHHLLVQEWLLGLIWLCIAAAAALSIRRK